MSNKHSRRQRGQATIMIALSAILLFGAIGLVTDIGWAYFRRQAAHAAIDAAVLAAAQAAMSYGGTSFSCGSNNLSCASSDTACANPPNTTPPLSTSDVACLYAQANGFVDGSASFSLAGTRNDSKRRGMSPMTAGSSYTQHVTYTCGISSSPPTVPGACVSYWFTMRTHEPLPQLFSSVLGNNVLTSSARATAAIVGMGIGGCIYVLDPSASKALFSNGGSDLESPCGIWVNSNASDAIFQTSGATINASPAQVQVVGGLKQTGHAVITPAPVTGISPFNDPLAGMSTPSYSSHCDYTNFKMTAGGTLSPGTYCGGISITGNGTVLFNSGLYVMLGGGLSMAGSANGSGSDVTFLLTGDGTYAYQGLSLTGTGTYSFSAPISGPYESMLFIKDRTQPAAGGSKMAGNSAMSMNGIIYLPNEDFTFSGGAAASSQYTTIVVNTLKVAGGAYVNANYSTLAGCTQGPRSARLIE